VKGSKLTSHVFLLSKVPSNISIGRKVPQPFWGQTFEIQNRNWPQEWRPVSYLIRKLMKSDWNVYCVVMLEYENDIKRLVAQLFGYQTSAYVRFNSLVVPIQYFTKIPINENVKLRSAWRGLNMKFNKSLASILIMNWWEMNW